MTFKVGDRVRTTKRPPGVGEELHTIGQTGTIVELSRHSESVVVQFDDRTHGFNIAKRGGHWHCQVRDLELIFDFTPEEALSELDALLEDP